MDGSDKGDIQGQGLETNADVNADADSWPVPCKLEITLCIPNVHYLFPVAING